jgi:retron-type reverse transcriptase
MDISKFFDTIDHELLMKAVKSHIQERWVLLYIERWLKVSYETLDGKVTEREMESKEQITHPIGINSRIHKSSHQRVDKLLWQVRANGDAESDDGIECYSCPMGQSQI